LATKTINDSLDKAADQAGVVPEAEEYDLDWLGDTETPSEMGDPQMIALYGQPGCGKTYLAASISEVEGYYPVLIIDTEGSTVGTLAGFRDDRITIKRVGTVAEFDKMIVSILTKPHPFKTVIVDTFGNALDRKEAQIFANLPKSKGGEDDGYAGWRILAVYAKKIIDGLREAPFKVVILFHEKEETNSLGQRISRVWINGSSKAYLPSKPDMFGLLRCETDDRAGTETRTLFLGNDTNRATKTRFTQLGLPLTIKNPTMAGIIGTIREHDKKEN